MTIGAFGLPGVKTTRTATPRRILESDQGKILLPRGRIIDGSEARDPLNTGDTDVIRAGVLMGRVGTTGLFAPSIVGLSTADYTDNDTTITCSEATAAEVLRRVGSDFASNDVRIVGAPTAGGVVATFTATLTAVTLNGASSSITTADLNADIEEGALICIDDGSYIPNLILGASYGVKVTDVDGSSIDVPMIEAIVGGFINTDNIVNWPAAANTTLIQWVKTQLKAHCAGLYYTSDFDATASVETTIEESDAFFATTDITGAEAETLTDTSDADSLHSHAIADTHRNTAQAIINIPLTAMTYEDGTPLPIETATHTGIIQLGNEEIVISMPLNTATTNEETLAFTIPLPPDLDETEDITIHVLTAKSADNDALDLDCEAYCLDVGDAVNAGTDIQDTAKITGLAQTLEEQVFTCGADGVLAAPSVLSSVLTLTGTNDGDAVYFYAVWVEYTRKTLGS